MWRALRPLLAGLDPVRIESHATGSGIPDVNTTRGWIELKYAARWPPRGGPLRVPHYSAAQRAWHVQRAQAGGRVWVLLKIGRHDWLLLDGRTAAQRLGYAPRSELEQLALGCWHGKPKNIQDILLCD